MVNQPGHEPEFQASAIFKAEDIAPAVRQWAASVLHVDLNDGDQLTLALRRAGDDDRAARRASARQRLLTLLARVDAKTRDVPEEEMEKAIDEAMQFVRSTPNA